jgi:hypothetical protein
VTLWVSIFHLPAYRKRVENVVTDKEIVVEFSDMECSDVECSNVECSGVKCSDVECSNVECSDVE